MAGRRGAVLDTRASDREAIEASQRERLEPLELELRRATWEVETWADAVTPSDHERRDAALSRQARARRAVVDMRATFAQEERDRVLAVVLDSTADLRAETAATLDRARADALGAVGAAQDALVAAIEAVRRYDATVTGAAALMHQAGLRRAPGATHDGADTGSGAGVSIGGRAWSPIGYERAVRWLAERVTPRRGWASAPGYRDLDALPGAPAAPGRAATGRPVVLRPVVGSPDRYRSDPTQYGAVRIED